MVRVVYAALIATGVAVCFSPESAVAQTTRITPEGAARLAEAKGPEARRAMARDICREAGHKPGSDQFHRCIREYRLHSAGVSRLRAKGLTDAVARRYGLCIDRRRFEIARCTEI